MTTPEQRETLWARVDAITKPSTMRLHRDASEVLAEFTKGVLFCRVEDYRALTVSHGTIPSLWEQAEQALTTGGEQMEGGSPSPGRSRSPADLDLMETLLTIRESMAWQLPGRKVIPKAGIPAQMRQLASHIVKHEPQHVEWWSYRFGQWARLLAVYLRAVDTGPRPVRLRNLPCPECHATHVLVETDQGETVAPPIMVDFVNGWIRAAQCTVCGHAWWRGQDLWDLARAEAYRDTPDTAVIAAGA